MLNPETHQRRNARFRPGLMQNRRTHYTQLEQYAESYINDFCDWRSMLKHQSLGTADIALTEEGHTWPLDIAELSDHAEMRGNATARNILNALDSEPEKMLEALENVLVWTSTSPGDEEHPDFVLPSWKIVNAERWYKDVGSVQYSDEGHIVQLKGTLLFLSDPIQTEYTNMAYACNVCGDIKEGLNLVKCPECGSKSIQFLQKDDRTTMRNFQESLMQENVDDLAGSPASISMRLFNDAINRFTPGDRITITGYVRLRDVLSKKNAKRYEIDVITASLTEDVSVIVTAEDRQVIMEMSKQDNVLSYLAKRFLPEIVGHDDVKQAIILQSVRGMKQKRSSSVVRDRIHILLAGDPGEAKSQFLLAHRYIHEKSMYISDTSKAGITVSVSDIGGKRVLSPGIMVLANRGVACLDELDKMHKDDREGMHTGMEQGVISKMKAGLRGTFMAETSVLAACNPKNGRFEIDQDIPSQLNLEPTLMDRFDLIFWFISMRKAEDNVELAMQVLKPSNHADPGFLKKYIHEAMKNEPSCSDEMLEEIARQWNGLKSISKNPVSIGFRALEGIRRISEASAKIRFSDHVAKQDVLIAVNLMKQSWGPLKYDLDSLGGFSMNKKGVMKETVELIKSSERKEINYDDIFTFLVIKYQEINHSFFDDVLETLKRTGQIYEPHHGVYRVIS